MRIHSCPGTGHTEGITVILSPRCNALSPALFQDIQGGGRLLRIDFTIEAQPPALVAVYGPALADLRRGFYREAVRAVLPTDGQGRAEVRAGFSSLLTWRSTVPPPLFLQAVPFVKVCSKAQPLGAGLGQRDWASIGLFLWSYTLHRNAVFVCVKWAVCSTSVPSCRH